jgi:hypothetical protein
LNRIPQVQAQSSLFGLNLSALSFYTEPNSAENTHVNIRHPNQRESSNQTHSPVWTQKFEAGGDQEGCCYVMAETVFAGEQVEEFPLHIGYTPNLAFAPEKLVVVKIRHSVQMNGVDRDDSAFLQTRATIWER